MLSQSWNIIKRSDNESSEQFFNVKWVTRTVRFLDLNYYYFFIALNSRNYKNVFFLNIGTKKLSLLRSTRIRSVMITLFICANIFLVAFLTESARYTLDLQFFLFQTVRIYDVIVHTVCSSARINSMNYVMSVARFSENASSTIHKLWAATIVLAHKICALSLMHYCEENLYQLIYHYYFNSITSKYANILLTTFFMIHFVFVLTQDMRYAR